MLTLVDGGIYECENGDIVKVYRNNLPYYCFSAIYIQYADEEIVHDSCSEKWTADGYPYHSGCGLRIVKQVN